MRALLVFLALAAAVIGSRWPSGERKQQALRLNAVARWGSVMLFGLVIAVTMTAWVLARPRRRTSGIFSNDPAGGTG